MAVAPPVPRWPSLNALRAFEAAARLGGFAAAAAELHVTPGAIASLVKALEQDIGAPLFQRHSRGVIPTEAGAQALAALTDAFDRMGLAVHGLRRVATPLAVHIAALPAVAQLWLAPRLQALRRALPGLDVSVSALETPPDLKRVPFDICIFFTDAPPRDATILAQDLLSPICSPDLASTLLTPADLGGVTCLSDTAWANDWSVWLGAEGLAAPPRIRGPVFSLYALAVEEALNGVGVLIGHLPLVADHLRSGALVLPFPQLVLPHGQLAAWSLGGSRKNAAVALVPDELRTLSMEGNPDGSAPAGRHPGGSTG